MNEILMRICINCDSKDSSKWYSGPVCRKCYRKDYYQTNKDKEKERQKEYHQNNKDKIREYRQTNKDKIKEYHQTNKDKIKEYKKEYHQTNKDKANEYQKEYQRNRLKTDINYKLAKNLRTRLYLAIHNNQKLGSAIKDLGCSIEELKQHLESLFLPGMTWDNWSNDGWHIDHKVPLSSFDLSSREEFLKANHYTNLQPMWAIDNLSKGNRID